MRLREYRERIILTLVVAAMMAATGWLIYSDIKNREDQQTMMFLQGVVFGQSTGYVQGYLKGLEDGKDWMAPKPKEHKVWHQTQQTY